MMPAVLLVSLLESAAWHVPFPLLDLAITEYALQPGRPFIELSPIPIARTRAGRVAIATAAAVGSTWLDAKLKNKPARWFFRAGHVVLGVWIVQHNARVMRRAR
jgi:hypothetical protein